MAHNAWKSSGTTLAVYICMHASDFLSYVLCSKQQGIKKFLRLLQALG
jgi:hypothetical protein